MVELPNLIKNTPPLDNEISQILDYAVKKNASDLHLSLGTRPIIRVDGQLLPVEFYQKVLTNEALNKIINSILTENLKARLTKHKEVDYSFSFEDKVRLRVNVYFERGTAAASLRLIPYKIKSIEELGLPPILEKFSSSTQGLFIVTGPTGHGKSTTLAAMVDYINKTRNAHIITIEDPIEYMFQNNKSLIKQREVYNDTDSFETGIKSTLREDPNVVLIGEMRDLDSIDAAMNIAETGHLVLTTLHTNNAMETADRIINIYPAHQQQQARMQLASVLLGVISQRLINRVTKGRIPAVEIMVANSGVRNIIRDGKTFQLINVINTSMSEGMISMDKVLADLVSRGEISIENALIWCNDPKALKMSLY